MKESKYGTDGNGTSTPKPHSDTPDGYILYSCSGGLVLTLVISLTVLLINRRRRMSATWDVQGKDEADPYEEMPEIVHFERRVVLTRDSGFNEIDDDGGSVPFNGNRDDRDDDDDDDDGDGYDEAASTDLFRSSASLKRNTYTEPLYHEKGDYAKPGKEAFEVGRDRIHCTGTIHVGRSHQICKGEAWFVGGRDGASEIAVKIPNDDSDSCYYRNRIRSEITVMKSLVDNDNVIKLLACCTKTDPPYLIMEYAQCGNLKQFLTKHVWRGSQSRHDDGSSKLKLSFAVDIASGMNYLTAKGIVYRALSAKHVLLDRNRVCKLSNFGYCSGAVDEEQAFSRTTDGGLAFQWLSIETLSRGLFNMKTDVWSFGVVLWEIFSEGSDPYDGADKSDVIMKLRRGYRLLKPENCEDELYNLMCSCWLKNPSERPNFFQLWETLQALVATTKEEIERKVKCTSKLLP